MQVNCFNLQLGRFNSQLYFLHKIYAFKRLNDYYAWGGGSNAKIHFIASKDFTDVNFFQNIDTKNSYDFSYLNVYINDTLTEQEANSISANADDDIKIISTTNKYPWFGRYTDYSGESTYNIDYIKSIEEPLPLMVDLGDTPITTYRFAFDGCSSLTSIPQGLFDNNPQITSLTNCFYGCTSLVSIPEGLFDNNPNITDFGYCFYNCSNITSIPQGLFDNNPKVTRFYCCFQNCTSLTAIPEGLFDNNPNANYFHYCFEHCTKLKVNVRIGSTTTNSVTVGNFANNTAEKGTVYCRAGSNAYNAFIEDTTANVNVLTY